MEAMETGVEIVVNGETRSAKAGASVSDILQQLGINAARVAIERNREILPRQQWAATQVQEGDRYEIVQFVGGG